MFFVLLFVFTTRQKIHCRKDSLFTNGAKTTGYPLGAGGGYGMNLDPYLMPPIKMNGSVYKLNWKGAWELLVAVGTSYIFLLC